MPTRRNLRVAMYTEVVLIEDAAHAEALSDSLLDAGALSATVEDADAGSTAEQPLFGEPGSAASATGMAVWNRSRIVALFDEKQDIDAAVGHAVRASGLPSPPKFDRRDVPDADWVRLTQAQFDPIQVGTRLWIVPSWHALPEKAKRSDAIVLELDPGLAFGTGSHATTRLCLSWLDAHLRPGQRVIDYGCGSGILAIAARKMGAGETLGTDIDAQALEAAIANARINGVDVRFMPTACFDAKPADVVVANILANPLKLLAPLLAHLVAPGGWLVLSGVLERQWPEVAAAYAPMLALSVWRSDDGWVCLTATRGQEDLPWR